MPSTTRTLCALLFAASLPAQLSNYAFGSASFQTSFGPLFGDMAGDLDGDGDLDLLQRQQTAVLQFQVWLNQGNLQFLAGITVQTPDASHTLLTDLNGDGLGDLIYSTTANTINVRFGLPGATFAAVTAIPTATSLLVQGLAAGDANGDGVADLAVVRTAFASATATWLVGSASGQFTEQTITLPVTQAPNSLTMVVIDADGDGSDDLAVASPAQFWLLRSLAGAPTVASNMPLVTSGFAPQLLAGELDNDNDIDVAAYTRLPSGPPTVRRLLNQGGGTFTASAPLTLPLTMAFATGYLADWDNDGDGDLVLRGSGYGSLLLALLGNDGTAFSIAWTDNSRATSSQTAFGIGVRDFDGDGNQDLIDNDLVYFGNGTLQPDGTPLAADVFGARDFENDGDPDFPGPSELWRNDGRGEFVREVIAMPPPAPGELYAATQGSPSADFDGDGLPEMLVAAAAAPFGNPFLRLHRFEYSGQGQFVNLGPAANSTFPLSLPAFAIDTNGDGVLDIVDQARVWTNNGAHQFQPQAPQFQGFRLLASGDIDGDGDVDLIGASVGMTTFAILRLTAADTFTVQVFATEPFANFGPNQPAMADLDEDGDLDVAVSNDATGAEVRIYHNQGGTLTLAATLPKPSEFVVTRAMAGDLDGDGRVDLAVGNGQSVRLWRRNGPGFTYDPAVVLPRAGVRDLVDVDQDGDADLVGSSVWLARSVGAAQGGQRRQYGLGLPGTGGRRPWLGASGRLRSGFVPSLRGSEGLGGSLALLAVGTAEANVAIPGLPSLVLYAPPDITLLTVSLSGTFGQAGIGRLNLPVAIPAGLQGLSLFFQMFVLDPAVPDLFAHSNGLEFRIGG